MVPLTEIVVVLDVLRYEPDKATEMAHKKLIDARTKFLDQASDGAWQGLVHAATYYQQVRNTPQTAKKRTKPGKNKGGDAPVFRGR